MAVNVSGTVLAWLFYENCSSHGDQVGFLVGEIVRHVKDTISDSQINNVEVNTRIYVFECVACPRDELFYNVRGEVDQQKIINLLPEKHQNIIGWYSFRRNSTMRPSFRERQLHQNLAGLLAEEPHMFPFLLCSAKASTNKSTHTLDHCFLHSENNMFKKMPVEIINLGDTTHAEYRSTPRHTVASKQGAFSKIVQQQEEQFLNSYGQMEVHQIQALNGAISRQLNKLAESVIKSEARCSDLEQEVLQYRRRVKQKQLESQPRNQIPNTSAKVKKGPSLDEILRMDETESAPECLLDPTRPLKGHNGGSLDSHDVSIKQQKDITEMKDNGAGDLNSQLKKVHLTPGAIVHTRSASSPVEMDSACAQVRHTRSKSSDHSTELSDSQPQNRQGDAFDYVDDMLAQSKRKDKDIRSRKTDKPPSDIANDLKETGNITSQSAQGSQKHAVAAKFAAQSLNQKTRTTRGQKLKGQGLRSAKTTNQDEDSDDETYVDNKNNLHEKRDLRKTNGPQKTAIRGTQIKQEKIVIESDDSSSPDTYDMDSMESSASPVY